MTAPQQSTRTTKTIYPSKFKRYQEFCALRATNTQNW
jgi:hypothetical protein